MILSLVFCPAVKKRNDKKKLKKIQCMFRPEVTLSGWQDVKIKRITNNCIRTRQYPRNHEETKSESHCTEHTSLLLLLLLLLEENLGKRLNWEGRYTFGC